MAGELESRLHSLTNLLVNELISLTPESMSEIQFELVRTDDGGADIGLLDNHPDATKVMLSDQIYATASEYLPVVKQYVPGWSRSLIVLRDSDDGWKVTVEFNRD